MTGQQSRTPIPVRILTIVLFLFSLFAFFGSLFMWEEGFLLQFPEGVDYRFPITDNLVNVPASMIVADAGYCNAIEIEACEETKTDGRASV